MTEEEERISEETGEKKVSKKRVMAVGAVIVAVIVIAIVAWFCIYNTSENRLARALDLGQKYLLEEDYEQAVVEFNKAIEIDPMSVDAYVGQAEAYIGLGEYDFAIAILEKGYEYTKSEEIWEMLNKYRNEKETVEDVAIKNKETDVNDVETFYPMIKDLAVPFTVDDIILGETSIETAKSAYANQPYVKSNLMNGDTDDTVYICFGHDTPILDGYEEDEFGFIFVESVNGGGIYDIWIRDPDFTCIGGLHIGDMGDVALEYFGLQGIVFWTYTDLEWTLDNGAVLKYYKKNEKDYSIEYELENNSVRVVVVNSVIHGIGLHRVTEKNI